MSRSEHRLTPGQRRAAVLVGWLFVAAAAGLLLVLGRRWWLLAAVLGAAGVLYWRAAWRGAVAEDADPPAPLWLRQRVARSRVFRWLVARTRPPAA